jgi:hypothetical protein
MRLFESTPSKVIVGTAAASLAALGIVVVAAKLTAPIPACVTVDQPTVRCGQQREAPPPPPAPEPCRNCGVAAPA